MTRVALCFPGQGSQSAGMAASLAGSPVIAALGGAASELGLDLPALLASDEQVLRQTAAAQPALLATELALAAELPAGLEVVGVAGHSVGEYSALAFAGALTPAAALRLVVARGRTMAAAPEGAMAAVLGVEVGAVESACAAIRATGEVVVVANVNAPSQLVISGSPLGVAAAARQLTAAGARRVVPLNVSGAFHSPLMHQAAQQFGTLVTEVLLADPRLPVVSNVDGSACRSAAEILERLPRQLESAVRWTDCVRTLVEELGAEVLLEVGPGTVLSGLARRLAPQARALSVADAAAASGVEGLVAMPA